MSYEEVYIGCRCGDEDCHYAAAGQPWCAPCERHIRLEELTEDGDCPRHQEGRCGGSGRLSDGRLVDLLRCPGCPDCVGTTTGPKEMP